MLSFIYLFIQNPQNISKCCTPISGAKTKYCGAKTKVSLVRAFLLLQVIFHPDQLMVSMHRSSFDTPVVARLEDYVKDARPEVV